MYIKEVEDFSYFSSDFNLKQLLLCDRDGNIRLDDSQIIETDSIKKYVRFYPVDNCVFTSTSSDGLSVWDLRAQKNIYSYKKEELYSHCYSSRLILSSFDQFNIKFYDLRSRYMINSKTHANCQKLDWENDTLFVLDDKTLTVYDYRSLNEVFSIKNVEDFCIAGGKLYHTSLEHGVKFLTCSPSLISSSTESIKKEVGYSKIQSIQNRQYLIGLTNKGFKIEKEDKIETFSLGNIEPDYIHYTDDIGYILTKDKIYRIDGLFD